MFAIAVQTASDGLTLRDVIVGIPHDLRAFIVYIILGIFFFLIWYGSRPSVKARYTAVGRELESEGEEARVAIPSSGPRKEAGGEGSSDVPADGQTARQSKSRNRGATRRER